MSKKRAGGPASAPKALRRGRAEARKGPTASGGGAAKAGYGKPTRGPLKSMRVSEGFRQFALDQLSAVDGLRAKSMFGGIGLYADDVFFGILAADVLYFKVDDTNRADYEAAGSEVFRPYDDRPMTMPYFAVPIEILEASPTLVSWAERSIAVARSNKKPPKKSRTVRSARL